MKTSRNPILTNNNERSASPAVAPDAIICRPTKPWIFFGLFVAILFMAREIESAISRASSSHIHSISYIISHSFLGVLLGCYVIFAMLKVRIILRPDAIKSVGPFGEKILYRDEIIGKRSPFLSWIPMVKLYARRLSPKKTITIPFWFDRNAEIKEWIAEIPDLHFRL